MQFGILIVFSCIFCAAAVLRDGSSFLTRRAEQSPVSSLTSEQAKEELKRIKSMAWTWTGVTICTTDQAKAWHKDMAEYRGKLHEASVKKTETKMDKLNATIAELMEPLRNTSKYAVDKFIQVMRPHAVKLFQWALSKILSPPYPYEHYKALDAEGKKAAMEEAARALRSDVPRQQAALWEPAAQAFDKKLDEAIAASFPKTAKLFPPLSTYTAASEYIKTRVLPAVFLKDFPVLSGLLLLTRLTSKGANPKTFVNSTVMPFMDATLPKVCQASRLITDIALGWGDMGSRLTKFVDKCSEGMDMALKVKMPKKSCSTCQEAYQKIISEGANSCVAHCSSPVMSCLKGFSDACLHSFMPCARCHKNRLEQLDKCTGASDHKKVIDDLDSMQQLLEKGSIEQAKADSFLDSLADAVVPPAEEAVAAAMK